MRTGNPILREEVFKELATRERVDPMTFQGVINKSLILFVLMVLTAAWTWSLSIANNGASAGLAQTLMMGGAIVGFVLALVTAFKPVWAPMLAPAYAVCQGAFLGGLSQAMNVVYPGIVLQAASLTFATLAMLLCLYKSGVIVMTDKLRLGIVAATGAIAVVYLVSIGLSFFGISVPFLYGNGWMSIGFSLFVVGLAAFNLLLDFDVIEQSVARRMPRYMEWYSAFALLVTLIWLYVEILRLLSKARSRD